MSNPFDSTDSDFLVLVNEEGQHSLWPAHVTVPTGWRQAHPPAPRDTCVAFVEANWTDLRPLSLRASGQTR